jgi:hypothetical protein
MGGNVKLSDLMEAIAFYSEESQPFIDSRTNEICIISESVLFYAENGDADYPDWQKEEVQNAKAYLENESNFILLPSQRDADEFSMMEDFIPEVSSERDQEHLFRALQGKGAFRRFKDTVITLGIENSWYQFRDERYKQFVMEWCDENGIKVDLQ